MNVVRCIRCGHVPHILVYPRWAVVECPVCHEFGAKVKLTESTTIKECFQVWNEYEGEDNEGVSVGAGTLKEPSNIIKEPSQAFWKNTFSARMMRTMYQANKLMWDGECADWDEAYNQAWREIFGQEDET